MMKTIKWFAGFFEDGKGSASSKRGTLYICLFYMFLLVKGSLENKPIEQNILFTIGAIILFCVGAVTSETFAKMYEIKESKTSTTTKTDTSTNIPTS
jgi:hypothetical protein